MSLKVKGLYANGMVLQRGMKNCAFGTADANSQVKLNFRNADFSSDCDAEGNWKIEFEVGDAGGPFELKISSGSDEAIFKDVYVGEVWVSSGQSNAQLPMSRMYFSYREEFELPANQNIRIITVPITYAFDGEKDSVENPQWNCACPEHLANMAGTSYFFAKKLQSDLGVPVGIINPAQGGSPINSWVNKEVLEKMNQEEFLATLKIYEDPKNIEDKKASVAKAQGEWAQKILDSDLGLKENWQELPVSSIDNDWSSCTIPGFIDELDCSLHPMLAKFLIQEFFKMTSCSQLIISVHNTYLLNKEIWRPDEVWFTEKQPNGASDMYSLSQFRPRFDRTLEKDYYKGKYGAIPFFGKLRV